MMYNHGLFVFQVYSIYSENELSFAKCRYIMRSDSFMSRQISCAHKHFVGNGSLKVYLFIFFLLVIAARLRRHRRRRKQIGRLHEAVHLVEGKGQSQGQQ